MHVQKAKHKRIEPVQREQVQGEQVQGEQVQGTSKRVKLPINSSKFVAEIKN